MANVNEKYPFLNDRMTMETVEVEKVHLYLSQMISEEMLDYSGLGKNMKFDIIRHAAGGMIMTLKGWCASGRVADLEKTMTVKWPDGVWQTFKEKFMPAWFTAKFPVRYAERVVKTQTNHYFVCPHIQVPDDRPHIQFMITGTKAAERVGRY